MTEVENDNGVESPDDAADNAADEPTTPPPDELSTWKARLAGKDRALSAAKAEVERLKKEADDLSRWKADKEQADMTEVDRLKQQLAALEAAKELAVREAQQAKLAREFPLAFDLLGEASPLDEGRLAEIEAKLKAKSEPEEPRIDPNQPRRTPGTAKASEEKTKEELLDDLSRMGNPFATPQEAFVPFRVEPR